MALMWLRSSSPTCKRFGGRHSRFQPGPGATLESSDCTPVAFRESDEILFAHEPRIALPLGRKPPITILPGLRLEVLGVWWGRASFALRPSPLNLALPTPVRR